MNIWVVMLIGGLLTFGMRLSFIYLFGRFEIPDMVRRALRFVPPAVLSAIILPQLFMPSGSLDRQPGESSLAGRCCGSAGSMVDEEYPIDDIGGYGRSPASAICLLNSEPPGYLEALSLVTMVLFVHMTV